MLSGKIGDKFTIAGRIGAGGFGSVFKCTDEFGGNYAVKCVEMGKEGIPHPLELSIMSSIRHPYINSAHKIYIKDDLVYIFMDLAKSDVSKIVRKDKNPERKDYPDPARLRKWLCSIMTAVACLHNQKIVHADIKASNILLFNDDSVKLSDFSLIVKLWKSDSKYNHTIGTSTHRPMENLLSRDWDTSLDIWCLGVTLYEIIYGELLFPYQGDFGKKKKDHLSERCTNCLIDWAERGPRKQTCNVIPFKYKYHPFNLVPEFQNDPCGLNDILMKMLSVNPSERPSINQILEHKYFLGYQKPLCTLVGTPTNKVKKARLNKIMAVCNSYSLGSTVISLAIELYARTMNIPNRSRDKDIRLLACIWIASKIIRKKVPSFNPPIKKILTMERTICSALEFKLHHTSNS